MNNYQKAIKIRKTCEGYKDCSKGEETCPYSNYCWYTNVFFFKPTDEKIEVVAKAIKEEYWKVD